MTIRTEQEYESALNELESLWDKVGKSELTEEESDKFNELQSDVEQYESAFMECDEEL